jgi:hypothetical protein
MTDPPFITSALPGVGGRIKVEPADFEVEEIPSDEPSGARDHLFSGSRRPISAPSSSSGRSPAERNRRR